MDAMLSEMSAAGFAEWLAFYGLEPWGAEADEHRAGVVAATIANVNRNKGAPVRTPSEFFPSRVQAAAAARVSVVDKVKAIFGWKGRG